MANYTKMPKEFEFLFEKLHDDKIYEDIKSTIQQKVIASIKHGTSSTTFCDFLKVSNSLPDTLLKKYGLTDRQVLRAFQEIGFKVEGNTINRTHTNLYYLTLIMLYWIGVKYEDQELRYYCVALIYMKLFNRGIKAWFPNGCQEEIANYVLNNMVNNNSKFKKYRNPVKVIIENLAPELDAKYESYIKKQPAHPTKGLMIILTASWNRSDQMFNTHAQKYYKANKDGKREVSTSTYNTGNNTDLVETKKYSLNEIHKLSQDTYKAISYNKSKQLPQTDSNTIKKVTGVSNKVIDNYCKYINDSSNSDDLEETIELLFQIMHYSETDQICSMHILMNTNKITNSKDKNNDKIQKYKNNVDNIIKLLYSSVSKNINNTQTLKLRKAFTVLLLFKIKQSSCKQAKIENTEF